MELDVTHMVTDADSMIELSGSRAEHGQDAGSITWNNATNYGWEHPLLTNVAMLDAARTYFKGFGAWSEEEIAAWSDAELQALACQDVANAIREMEVAEDYEDYLRLCEQGTCSGSLYKGDNGRWYFYMGS